MYIRLCLICVHVSCISIQPIGHILDWSSKLALICNYGDTNWKSFECRRDPKPIRRYQHFGSRKHNRPERWDGRRNDLHDSITVLYDHCLPAKMSHSGNFNVISLNAQSINAKSDSLLTFLEVTCQQNIILHVICIQETWLDEKSDLSLYQIEGYTCISQGKRCSSHGGLITYVDSQFKTSIMNIKNDSPIWEGLFVGVKEMETEKEIVVGNIYRPPYDNNSEQNVTTFVTELEPIIATLNDNNQELLIAGDFNINLLHINTCNKEHFWSISGYVVRL